MQDVAELCEPSSHGSPRARARSLWAPLVGRLLRPEHSDLNLPAFSPTLTFDEQGEELCGPCAPRGQVDVPHTHNPMRGRARYAPLQVLLPRLGVASALQICPQLVALLLAAVMRENRAALELMQDVLLVAWNEAGLHRRQRTAHRQPQPQPQADRQRRSDRRVEAAVHVHASSAKGPSPQPPQPPQPPPSGGRAGDDDDGGEALSGWRSLWVPALLEAMAAAPQLQRTGAWASLLAFALAHTDRGLVPHLIQALSARSCRAPQHPYPYAAERFASRCLRVKVAVVRSAVHAGK